MIDEHGNQLFDELELRVLMELQEWKHGQVAVEWHIHDMEFQLIREDEDRPGREHQRNRNRKFRLYDRIHGEQRWHPSFGGQWHDDFRTAYARAKYVADGRFRTQQERKRRMEYEALRARALATGLYVSHTVQMPGGRPIHQRIKL